jgi:hypothetical protein
VASLVGKPENLSIEKSMKVGALDQVRKAARDDRWSRDYAAVLQVLVRTGAWELLYRQAVAGQAARGAEARVEAHKDSQPAVLAGRQDDPERRITVGVAVGVDGEIKQWQANEVAMLSDQAVKDSFAFNKLTYVRWMFDALLIKGGCA